NRNGEPYSPFLRDVLRKTEILGTGLCPPRRKKTRKPDGEDDAISRELWLRSRHGTWRFFRLTSEYLVELGQDGHPLLGKTAANP
ncbi:MAG: hypothetical protein WC626_01865, partial [Methanoregula sp.]